MTKKLLFVTLFLCISYITLGQNPMTPSPSAVTAGANWTTTKITTDNALDLPWEIIYGPDNNLWITERRGVGNNNTEWELGGQRIVRVSSADGLNNPEVLIDLDSKITPEKQGGLMGMAIHPDLYDDITTTTNNYVFAAYTYDDSGNLKARIVRLLYNHNLGVLTEDTSLDTNGTLLEGLPGSDDHNSGRLKFGPDQKLYYTIGDQGSNQFANVCNPIVSQNLPNSTTDYDNYAGKILRLNIDGSIPSDNPTLNGIKSHVYTYGHRNAQGIAFALDGTLYSSEHGPRTDDEINIIKSGKNYGWPEIAGYYDNRAYTYVNQSTFPSCTGTPTSEEATEYQSYPLIGGPPSDFENPIGTYNSTVDTEPTGNYLSWPGVAPSSIAIHENANIPCWGKSLLIPTLKKGTIYRAKLNVTGDDIVDDFYEEFHSSNDRYRDIAISPDGLTIYAVTDNSGGTSGPSSTSGVSIANPGVIIKIQYVGPAVTDPITAPTLDDVVSYCPVTLTPPTALNNSSDCQEITATTTDPTTYSSGSHVVTWSFDDNGTIVTANQNVIINALETPSGVNVVPATTTADISWNALENADFDVRYREVGSFIWLTESTTTNNITLSGLTLSTDYEFQIRSNCGSSQSPYTILDIFSTTAINYCDAYGVNGGHIDSVIINGENATSINNSSTGDAAYTDYTSITPVDLNANGITLYTIDLNASYGDAGYSVWIDFNQNGDFTDANERVWGTTDNVDLYNGTASGSFTVPLSALNGNTRMRIASRQFWTSTNSCGQPIVEAGQNSEVEDYTVNIISSTLTNNTLSISEFKVFPNPIKDQINISISGNYDIEGLFIELHDVSGRVITHKKVSQLQTSLSNLSSLNSGIYFIRFKNAKGSIGSKKIIKI